uniref:Uncharacterized protein n=1 Tax=Arion vulgaris TaxID=1028688 RepID=A0A0B6ZJR5_9EUPU
MFVYLFFTVKGNYRARGTTAQGNYRAGELQRKGTTVQGTYNAGELCGYENSRVGAEYIDKRNKMMEKSNSSTQDLMLTLMCLI